MICGFLHPTFEKWLKAVDDREPAVRRTMRAVLAGVAAAAGLVWYNMIYTLPKLEYNKVHPYTSWIPITAFLILRNITPSLRLKSLGLYGWLGCITLETYVLYVFFVIIIELEVVVDILLLAADDCSLMTFNYGPLTLSPDATSQAIPHVAPFQGAKLPGTTHLTVVSLAHHAYFITHTHPHHRHQHRCQPIYLLSLLPEYPLINFTVVTALYIFLAFRLFKSTAWLRDAVIPHDDDALLCRNLLTMALGVGFAWLVGFAVQLLAQSI